MDIQERTHGVVALIDVSGRLVAGEQSGQLKDKVNSLIYQGRRQIVLNLAGVSYIDSMGLGELVAVHATVAKQGGQIVLVALTTRVQDLLAICLATERGKLATAEKLARGVLSHDQDDAVAHYALGRVLLQSGQRRQAFREFSRARALAAGMEVTA